MINYIVFFSTGQQRVSEISYSLLQIFIISFNYYIIASNYYSDWNKIPSGWYQ